MRALMTSGVDPGTRSLRRAPRWALVAYPGMLVVGALVAGVNAFTALSDAPHRFGSHALASLLVIEATSIAALLLLLPAVWRLVVLAPPQPGGWRRFGLVHAIATVPFSAAHIGLFDLFRWLASKAGMRDVCCVRLPAFVYEYRKDLITYGAIVGIMGGVRMLEIMAARKPAPAASPPVGGPPILVKEGARTLRLEPDELIAVRAAGNYVEHLLLDGRAVLERATLAEAQARLQPHGFLRTHRSWLVNPAAVKAITREGSGDRTLTLAGGVCAPVSRRYAEALAKLEV